MMRVEELVKIFEQEAVKISEEFVMGLVEVEETHEQHVVKTFEPADEKRSGQ